jgi:hypothetical protein
MDGINIIHNSLYDNFCNLPNGRIERQNSANINVRSSRISIGASCANKVTVVENHYQKPKHMHGGFTAEKGYKT